MNILLCFLFVQTFLSQFPAFKSLYSVELIDEIEKKIFNELDETKPQTKQNCLNLQQFLKSSVLLFKLINQR